MNTNFHLEKPLELVIENPIDASLEYILSSDLSILEHRKVPFRSFVGNFGKIIAHLITAEQLNITLVNGASLEVTKNNLVIDVEESSTTSNNSTYGIWFGDALFKSANTTLIQNTSIPSAGTAHNDYTLRGKFSDSDISYTNTRFRLVSEEQLEISRTLINNSLNTIYVSEFGLIGQYNSGTGVLLARDVITENGAITSVAVKPGYMLTVRYSFKSSDNGFTNNFIKLLTALLRSDNSLASLVDVNGVPFTENYASVITGSIGHSTDDSNGIIICKYNDELVFNYSKEKYDIPDKISEGSVVDYYSTETLPFKVESDGISFGLSRIFENVSDTESTSIGSYVLALKQNTATNPKIYTILGSPILETTLLPYQLIKLNVLLKFKVLTNRGIQWSTQ